MSFIPTILFFIVSSLWVWADLPDDYLDLGLPADQVSFSIQGNPAGKDTAILLHGVGSRKETWNSVIREMGPKALSKRLVTVDRRGHGSTPVGGIDQRPWLHAVDIKNWMDAHGIQKAHFVGHSLGGRDALAFAALFPKRVKSLVIVDIAPFKDRHDEVTANQIRAGALVKDFADDCIAQSWGEDVSVGLVTPTFPVLFMSGSVEKGAIFTQKHKARLANLNPALLFSHFENSGHGLYKQETARFVSELEAFWTPKTWPRRCLDYLRSWISERAAAPSDPNSK